MRFIARIVDHINFHIEKFLGGGIEVSEVKYEDKTYGISPPILLREELGYVLSSGLAPINYVIEDDSLQIFIYEYSIDLVAEELASQINYLYERYVLIGEEDNCKEVARRRITLK